MSTKTYAHDKRGEKKAQKEILAKLAELGGKVHDDDDVTYEGKKLIIPMTMTIDRAIEALVQKRDEMESYTDFSRVFKYRPWDGAYCMWNALKRVFGLVGHKGTPGFFGESPPEMRTINIDVGKQEQVPWGGFQIPLIKDVTFYTHGLNHPEYGPLFAVNAEGPKKWSAHIEGVFNLVEEELKKNSMYRGKAFDGQAMPEFIDLSTVDPNQVVYSKEVLRQLEVNIWAQLRHTEAFAKRGVPLKRAVLVHGPYGTGKTLAAVLTGQEAIANGWTFIKARPGRDDLYEVMQTARLYQPAVVFYEDVDQITDSNDVSESTISQLLDTFDGVEAKNSRLLVVLTTNHAERIHKGMARPGRLDAMIEINDLDQEGVVKLVTCKVGEMLADKIDWDEVYEAAEGYKPAFVTEFSDRAIRYALLRNKGNDEGIQIETEDLASAARDLRPQFDLMSGAKDRVTKPVLDEALRDVIKPVAVEAAVQAVRENVIDDVLVANGH